MAGNFPPPFANDRTVSFASYLGDQTAAFGQPGNPDLKPEKTHTVELGGELQALTGRLTLQVNWYDARTRDALFLVPSPPSSGEGTQLRNVGEIANNGVEIQIVGDVVRTQSVTARLTASYNTLHNEVIDAGGSPVFGISGFSSSTVESVVKEGWPVGALRGTSSTLNADGTIAKTELLQYLGKPLPDRFGSLGLEMTFGSNLRLQAHADWQTGAQLHSFNRQFRYLYGIDDPELPPALLEANPGPIRGNWLNLTNFFVENTDYLRVRSISADYSLAGGIIGSWARDIDLGITLLNPLGWWTSSFDPESDHSGAASQGAASVGGFNYASDPSPVVVPHDRPRAVLGGRAMHSHDSNSRITTLRTRAFATATVFALATAAGCDLVDPTHVTNPTVTEETFVETSNAAASWTRGVERQLAATINTVITGTEVVSDNLFNNRTLFSKVFDIPQIDASDFDVRNIQADVHRLRAMADQGLNVILPGDPSSTTEMEAQLHFHRGFAYLLGGELFVGLPVEGGGPVVEPSEHLALAVQDFQQAASMTADAALRNAAMLGVARAQYDAGNRDAAVAAAQQVKAADPTLIRWVQYDNVDGPTNSMQFAIYDSGQDEFQPLPRLDFLFPKYYSESAGDQSPIAILKGEEAYLIIAEADLSQGDVGGARSELSALLGLVASRPTAMIDDRGQQRGRRGGTWIYPNTSDILVKASPDAEARAGLVLTRATGLVEVPTVSGTSVTQAMLDGATTVDDMLYLLYLMRQEIFVVEGRRMTDLGIRFPVALDEALTNPNVDESSPALTARMPSFIPQNYQLDGFTYEDGDTLAVILHDMNAVLVANKNSSGRAALQLTRRARRGGQPSPSGASSIRQIRSPPTLCSAAVSARVAGSTSSVPKNWSPSLGGRFGSMPPAIDEKRTSGPNVPSSLFGPKVPACIGPATISQNGSKSVKVARSGA